MISALHQFLYFIFSLLRPPRELGQIFQRILRFGFFILQRLFKRRIPLCLGFPIPRASRSYLILDPPEPVVLPDRLPLRRQRVVQVALRTKTCRHVPVEPDHRTASQAFVIPVGAREDDTRGGTRSPVQVAVDLR